MADTSQDMPVFGPDGRMMGNLTSSQGQPPSSAFDQPWSNPLDSMGGVPTFDYGKAVAAKKGVVQKELGAVSGIMGSTEAAEKKYQGIADRKFKELESFDPNEIKPWNAQEEQKKYQDDPYSAFGSFAMVASLGLAAFTKTPFINSMNAMAGVINGRREANDQAYERAYKAWQDNFKLFQERFSIVKEQVGSAVTMMKEQGEIGKTKLANTLTKYGLMQDLAMLNAGYDDVLAQKWVAQANAVAGMAEAREKIETLHSVDQALKTEDSQRAAIGMPPMTPQEKLEMKSYLTEKHTPEQIAFQDSWHTFIREHPNATAQEKAQFMQQAKAYGSRAAGAQNAAPILNAYKDAVPDMSPSEEAMIRSAIESKGAKAPQAIARMTDAIDQIIGSAQDGKPMDAGQRAALLRQAAGGVSGLDEDGLKLAAANWIKTGQFPSRNWEANQKILDYANKMLKDQGIDPKNLPKMQQEFKAQQIAIQRYMSGQQGQATGAINMVIHHIGTLRELGKALDNGDYTLANWIANKAATELGKPEPNNFNLGAQVVVGEMMRAMQIAGAGTGEERDSLQSRLRDNLSPEQIDSASDTIEHLLAGKLFANRFAFPVATGLSVDKFDQLLSERTKSILLPMIGEDKPVEQKSDVPPVNLLQEGHVTTFKNGQSWTLKGGKPVKVDQP
jgi:hypothetical protein